MHICMQDGMHNTRTLKWLESGGSRRFADLMTQRLADKRQKERERRRQWKKICNESTEREHGNSLVIRYGTSFLVAFRHSVYTEHREWNINDSIILWWITKWIYAIDPKLEAEVWENTWFPTQAISSSSDEKHALFVIAFFRAYREFRIRSNWNVVLNGILSSGTAEMWTESKELRYSDRGSNRSNRVTFDLRNGDHHHTLPLTLRWDRRFLYINSDYVKANKFRSQTILGRHFKVKIQCGSLDKLSLELLLKNL